MNTLFSVLFEKLILVNTHLIVNGIIHDTLESRRHAASMCAVLSD